MTGQTGNSSFLLMTPRHRRAMQKSRMRIRRTPETNDRNALKNNALHLLCKWTQKCWDTEVHENCQIYQLQKCGDSDQLGESKISMISRKSFRLFTKHNFLSENRKFQLKTSSYDNFQNFSKIQGQSSRIQKHHYFSSFTKNNVQCRLTFSMWQRVSTQDSEPKTGRLHIKVQLQLAAFDVALSKTSWQVNE